MAPFYAELPPTVNIEIRYSHMPSAKIHLDCLRSIFPGIKYIHKSNEIDFSLSIGFSASFFPLFSPHTAGLNLYSKRFTVIILHMPLKKCHISFHHPKLSMRNDIMNIIFILSPHFQRMLLIQSWSRLVWFSLSYML